MNKIKPNRKGIQSVLVSILILCAVVAVYSAIKLTSTVAYANSAYESYLEDKYPNLLTYEVFTDNLKNIEQLYTDVENVPKHIAISETAYKEWKERHSNDSIKRTATIHAITHVAPPLDETLTLQSRFEYLVLISVREQEADAGNVHYLAVTFDEGMITELVEIV